MATSQTPSLGVEIEFGHARPGGERREEGREEGRVRLYYIETDFIVTS